MKRSEYEAAGWTVAGTALTKGYTSAKIKDPECWECNPRGKWAGCVYCDMHNPRSSRFSIRVYLRKED